MNTSEKKTVSTSRALWKVMLFGLLTGGIYVIFFFAFAGRDLNRICAGHNGDKTMSFWLLFFLVGPLTLFIGSFVWMHKMSARAGREAELRQTGDRFGAKDFWLWNVLGVLILVGPFIYLHKLCRTMNGLCRAYNCHG